MEERVKNLEDLCEMITKEIVTQNKSMIEMNKNLINEIKCLRETFVKQDVSFRNFYLPPPFLNVTEGLWIQIRSFTLF